MADQIPLPGSERPRPRGAQRLRDLDPAERIEITVTVTRDRGSDAIGQVAQRLGQLGLTVLEQSSQTMSLRLSGSAAQMEAAFKPGLGVYSHPEQGEFRGREGQLQIPADLEGLVTGVFGLDQRRVARRRHGVPGPAVPDPAQDAGGVSVAQQRKSFLDAASTGQALTPAQLTSHYNFPPGDGSGQTVAIAEFGGGYFASDLQAFCAKQGTAVPKVTPVSVNGAPLYTLAQIQQLPQQQQQEQLDDSVEVNMDIQIVAGLAPGADQIVYFSSFDEQGWVDLLNQVIARTPAPAVTLSVSWGLAEDDPDWSKAALQAIDERLEDAAALGITVCVAAGDDGSADQESDGRGHVDFPASSPHALAVGGTMLSGETDVVWWQSPGERSGGGGATGGGVSVIFPRPSWQDVQIASINPGAIDGRVIPDIAALAGPPFYDLIFTGQDQPNGGTSAATPLWASLIALLAGSAEQPWKPQFLAPLLYAAGTGGGSTVGAAGCTDVTSGDNTSSTLGKGYSAGPGYDAVSGWGVPNGAALLRALSG
jgi:kumamolisin